MGIWSWRGWDILWFKCIYLGFRLPLSSLFTSAVLQVLV